MIRIYRSAVFLFVFLLMAGIVLLASPQRAQADAGTDWIGQFYNTTDLSGGVVATASFPTGLNFNWGDGPPNDGFGNIIPGVNADGFSARIVTTENLTAGLYEFVLTAKDGIRLSIDGNVVLDNFGSTSLTTDTTIVSLGGGVYTIIVEYVNYSGSAVIQVNWFPSTGEPQATATPLPIAIGNVERVRGLAVRTGPYLGASLVAVARPERDYPVLERNFSEGVFTWYRIRVNENIVGWSSGRYLNVTGNLDAVPFVGTIFDEIDHAPDRGVIGTTRSVMNFRVRPSVRTQRIGQIPWGAQVSIIGRTIQGGRDFWYHVRYEGQVGWILAAYVGVSGNPIDAVPIY